jgi:high affinity Mn2+ porin
MRTLKRTVCFLVVSATLLVKVAVCPVSGQTADTIVPHSEDERWWVSGQANLIFQWHGAFQSPYQGEHSFRSGPDHSFSRVLTLFTGYRLRRGTELQFDVESASGRGVGDAFGLAGYTDLDVVRNPSLGTAPYVARAMLHQTIALGREIEKVDRGPFSLAAERPIRRIEVRVGKFGMVDWFDVNQVGGDSHLQFLNWTVDNSGAYDYAADTRGYTYGVKVEYHDAGWAVRFAEGLMPKVANGIVLDFDVARARAENVELELNRGVLPRLPGTIRVLAYVNHADMGSYREAIDAFKNGVAAAPSIESTRRQGRIKYGFGLNLEQRVSRESRVFARGSWSEGHQESFAYTEVDRALATGGDLTGDRWRRPADKIGLTVSVNGLSSDHSEYLALGGLGFLLGDGRLTYGTERIVEAYYTAHVWRGVFASFDVQRIVNPGYNRDRGPVLVPALRAHFEF